MGSEMNRDRDRLGMLRRFLRMQRQIARAMAATPTTATPTPMPILAVLASPVEGLPVDAAALVVDEGAADVVLLAVDVEDSDWVD